MQWKVTLNSKEHRVTLPDDIPDNQDFEVKLNGRTVRVRWQRATRALFILDETKNPAAWRSLHTRTRSVAKFAGESDLTVGAEFTPAGSVQTLCLDATVALYIPGQEGREGAAAKKPKVVRSQITGKVLRVMAKPGDTVAMGDVLMIVEAMKMENRILATGNGTVDQVKVKEGDTVSAGAELVRMK